MQSINHRSSKVMIAGASGCGKTTLALGILTGCVRSYERVYVFDGEEELEQRIGVESVSRVQELERGETPFRIFDPISAYDPPNVEQAFEDFCIHVFDTADSIPGNKLVVIDELQKYVDVNKPFDGALRSIFQTGRRKRIDALFITQAPNEIHTKIKQQCTELFLFRLLGERSTKFPNEVGITDAELESLRVDGEFIHVDLRTMEKAQANLFTDDLSKALE
jgi:type IV secretory pathway VirB4 component